MNHLMLSERHAGWLSALGIDPEQIDIPLLSAPQHPNQMEAWLQQAQKILTGAILPKEVPVGDCLLFPIEDGVVSFWGWDGQSREAVLAGLDFSTPLLLHRGNPELPLWITGNPLRALRKMADGHSVIGVPSSSSLDYWPNDFGNTDTAYVAATEQTLIRRLNDLKHIDIELKWSQKDPVRHLDGLTNRHRTLDRVGKFEDFKVWALHSFQENPSGIGIPLWRGMSVVFASDLRYWFEEGGCDMKETLLHWWQKGHMGAFGNKSITIHDPASRKKKKAYVFQSLVTAEELCQYSRNIG